MSKNTNNVDYDIRYQAKLRLILAWQDYEEQGLSFADFHYDVSEGGGVNDVSYTCLKQIVKNSNRIPSRSVARIINRRCPSSFKLKQSIVSGRVTPIINAAPVKNLMQAVLTSEKANETLKVSG